MAVFKALLGDKLVGPNNGEQVDTEAALTGKKAVGLYFSAHWCPPCRGFTPKLAEFYKNGLKDAGMEIVFISSDKDEAAFGEYAKDQPWHCMPYADRAKKAELSKKFKVAGIPTFVVLDENGVVTTKDGRSKVMADPKGEQLPWAPKAWKEIIAGDFVTADGTADASRIEGKHLLIYFSAHWCPPCRGFTPVLAKAYKAYKEKGLNVEVIFSTGDRDEKSFTEYLTSMKDDGGDWLAIPFADSARREALDTLFEVQGIPTLVIVDPDGKLINANGRGEISADPTGDNFPWAPPLVKNLAQPEGIDECPSICIFMEQSPAAQQKEIEAAMAALAKKYKDEAGDDDPKFLFFAAKNGEGPVPQIRSMAGLPPAGSSGASVVATKGESSPQGLIRSISRDIDDSQPVMLLLNLDDDGAFYKSSAPIIDQAAIEELIKGYEEKTLTREQLKK